MGMPAESVTTPLQKVVMGKKGKFGILLSWLY